MDAAKGVILMANHPGCLEEYYSGAVPRAIKHWIIFRFTEYNRYIGDS